MWWVYMIGLVWVSEFILSCQQMVIAGAVAHWYFDQSSLNTASPTSYSAKYQRGFLKALRITSATGSSGNSVRAMRKARSFRGASAARGALFQYSAYIRATNRQMTFMFTRIPQGIRDSKKLLKSPTGRNKESGSVLSSTYQLICYHLGSVAKGSFLVTLVKLPRLILTYIDMK
uniref:Choline transporter-like protein n=1 Tax=Timema californicum TaxID=61474 RepID=A0A7R9PDP1_TIMCA|nr:unnamed protein product [Timema californicum]